MKLLLLTFFGLSLFTVHASAEYLMIRNLNYSINSQNVPDTDGYHHYKTCRDQNRVALVMDFEAKYHPNQNWFTNGASLCCKSRRLKDCQPADPSRGQVMIYKPGSIRYTRNTNNEPDTDGYHHFQLCQSQGKVAFHFDYEFKYARINGGTEPWISNGRSLCCNANRTNCGEAYGHEPSGVSSGGYN